jgi:hypothetical protein
MRNYLNEQVGQSLAIANLLGRLQAPSPMRQAIGGSGPFETGLSLLHCAAPAETARSITSDAQQKLNTTSPAIDDPKGLRRLRLRNRRLLDMELRPW